MSNHIKKYKAAIIGCGKIGAAISTDSTGNSRILSHAHAYSAISKTSLIAIADTNAKNLDDFGNRWFETKAYLDPIEMIESEKIDILSIATPVSTHFELLQKIFNLNTISAVILEKPIALTRDEANDLIKMEAKSKTKVLVNYIRRFPPVYRKSIKDLREGKLGEIQVVTNYYTKGLINNGTHTIDLLRTMFGEPSKVAALGAFSAPYKTDLSSSIKLTFDPGFDAYLIALDSKAYNIFDIDILGTKGRLAFRDLGHTQEYYPVEHSKRKHGFSQLSPNAKCTDTDLSKAIQFGIESLISSIEQNQAPICTLSDGLRALEIALKINS